MDWASLGMAGIQAAGQFGLNQGDAAIKNKRQYRYWKKTQAKNIAAQKELGDYNKENAMDLWNRTNVGAQMEHMKKAGLNIGLMYGGSGAGGTTSGAGVANANGEDFGGGGGSGMGLDIMTIKQQQAQTNLLNEEARKTKIEADKAAGIDTEKTTAETENLKIQNRIKRVEADVAEATTYHQKEKIINDALVSEREYWIKAAKADVDTALIETDIEKGRQELVRLKVNIAADKAGIELTEAQTQETTEKINKIATEVINMQKLTEIEKEKMLSQRMQTEFNTSEAAQIKQWTDIGTDIVKAAAAAKGKTSTTETVKGDGWSTSTTRQK